MWGFKNACRHCDRTGINGVRVSHGPLGQWVVGSSEKHLHRIYDALKLRLRSQPLIQGDGTTIQVPKAKDKDAPAHRICGLSGRRRH